MFSIISRLFLISIVLRSSESRKVVSSPCPEIFQFGLINEDNVQRPVGLINVIVPKPQVYEFNLTTVFAIIRSPVSQGARFY